MPAARSGRAMSSVLVRLDADQRHEAEVAALTKSRQQCGDVHPRMRLVDRIDVDADIGSQHLALGTIDCNAVDSRQRVRGNHRPPSADDIAIVVVMRRFDQNELKATVRRHESPTRLRAQHSR